MKTDVNVKVDVAEDVKNMLNKYSDIQQQKYDYQKEAATEDENKLCFRICTASGTRINIPPTILKDCLIAGGIIAGAKIVLNVIELTTKFKK